MQWWHTEKEIVIGIIFFYYLEIWLWHLIMVQTIVESPVDINEFKIL